PQVIPQVFNPGGFGPPRSLTSASTCPWLDHSASGLERATETALFGLAFATTSPPGLTSQHTANSQAHSSKGTQSRERGKPRSDAPTACRHTVSGTISLPSRGTFHHSLTVLSAIGHQGIFRLGGWSRRIHTGFLGPRATWVSLQRAADVSATGVLPSAPDLSHVLRLRQRFL
ncbi:LOW QUALITY PROTEIN: conserved hypothetical protein, partial [Streptomyces viridosporus ATCC 14672]